MKRFLSFAVLAVMHFPRCATNKNAVRWYNHRYQIAKQYKIITKHLGDLYED